MTTQPQPVRDLIERLEQGPELEIGSGIALLTNWHYPRGDLFHWTQVLNRFDTILERICDEYKLQHTQARDFEKDTKKILLDIINLSRLLFENCTNRNIYNSYEVLLLLLLQLLFSIDIFLIHNVFVILSIFFSLFSPSI